MTTGADASGTLGHRRWPGRFSAWIAAAPLTSALVTAGLGLLLTAALVGVLRSSLNDAARNDFEHHAERLALAIEERFERPEYGLKALHALYSVRGTVDRTEFRRFVVARDMNVEFPGVRGFGYIEPVQRSELSAFVRREQADAAPDFGVRSQGERDELQVIKFIEPLQENQAAWGLDLAAEPVRRSGVASAAGRGDITLSGCVTLVQDQHRGPGFLMMLPVYLTPMTPNTPELRRLALQGTLYSPLAVAELLAGVAAAGDGQIDFELRQGPSLLIDSTHRQTARCDGATGPAPTATPEAAGPVGGSLVKAMTLEIGGQPLQLLVRSSAAFDAQLSVRPVWWAGAGAALSSCLMATMVWLLGAGRLRSIRLAQRMTADLRRSSQQAQSALRETQALLSVINQHALVSVADLNGRIIEVNDAFCSLSGYSREELLGADHRLVNSGVQDRDFWERMWITVSAGGTWRGEVCNRAKDGMLYWVDSVIAPMFDSQGMVVRYLSIRHNITGLKQAKLDLAYKDEQLEMALEGGEHGLWDWSNVRGQASWWSPQMYRMLGYAPGEISADQGNFDRLLHPDDRGMTYHAMEAALKAAHARGQGGGEASGFDIEARMRCKSGQYRWFRTRAKVFFDAAGDPTRMAGSIQDVHDRWTAQRQTQEHSEQLDAIFALSPDGFVSFDAQGRVSYVSPAGERLTGLGNAECRGWTEAEFLARLRDLLVPGPGQPTLEQLSGGIGASAGLQVDLHRVPPVSLVVRRHQGDSSAISGVIQLRDVTREIEVDRLKSEFLSTAAHELRTPMASIYGFTELLMSREMPADKRQTLLGRVYRQSQAMIAIINELLDLARIEARRGQDFHFEATDLGELVAQTVQDFQPPDGRQPPELDLGDGLPKVRVDRSKLAQTLRNLLSNAYKYSPEGGAVQVRLRPGVGEHGEPRVGLEVEDHGLGMTPEQLARVCERFFRADLSGSIPGTGLGMSIVQEIISLHGGELRLSSRPGQGSTMGFWLPALAAEADQGETVSLAEA